MVGNVQALLDCISIVYVFQSHRCMQALDTASSVERHTLLQESIP